MYLFLFQREDITTNKLPPIKHPHVVVQRYKNNSIQGNKKATGELWRQLRVICTRFELVTSCLSSKRSKPTELTDHVLSSNTLFSSFFSSKANAKVHTFLKLTKLLRKKLYFCSQHTDRNTPHKTVFQQQTEKHRTIKIITTWQTII